jgi:hypothetical protein
MDVSNNDVIRQVNDETLASAEAMEARSSLRLRWGFLCECGDPKCTKWIKLTRDEYVDLRAREERVLAWGHEATVPRD